MTKAGLQHNGWRPYLPELPGDDTGSKAEVPQAALEPETFDVEPQPITAGRNPYKSYLKLIDEGERQQKFQNHVKIPMNPKRRQPEFLLQCTKVSPTHGQRCQYWAKSKAELDRHERFAHKIEQEPLPQEGAVPADDVDLLPGYQLGDAVPPKPKKLKPNPVNEDPMDEQEEMPHVPEHEDIFCNSDAEEADSVEHHVPEASHPAEPPPLVVPPPPVPLPTVAAVRAPHCGGNWKMVEIPGCGWLKFNEALQRLDAHCGRHEGRCKMDRSLKKAPISLHMAWLAHCCGSKAEHDKAKVTLNSATHAQERSDGMKRFMELVRSRGGIYEDIKNAETRATGML